eukprot:44000-Eustigmatos_ZCMA.PRE.1
MLCATSAHRSHSFFVLRVGRCPQAIDHYVKAPTTNAFKRIFEIYLCVGAPKAVNVPHSISNAIHDVNAALLKALEDEMGARLTMQTQDKP